MFKLVLHPEAEKEIFELDDTMRGKVYSALDKLELLGNKLRYPATESLGGGLFELRVGKKDISRTFFAFEIDSQIYILRTFVKKTQKTPPSELKLARKRLEELING